MAKKKDNKNLLDIFNKSKDSFLDKKKEKDEEKVKKISSLPRSSKNNEDEENFGDKLKKVGVSAAKTIGNLATNMGEGALKTGEGILDTLNNVSNAINNPIQEKAEVATGISTKEAAKKHRLQNDKNNREFVKRNLTNEYMEKTGFNDIKKDWEKDSLIKSNNLGGTVSQAIGGMVPSLVAGSALGMPEIPLESTKGLSLGAKAVTTGKNIAKATLPRIGSTGTLATSAYGNALEEAYNNGATDSEANRYALGSSAVEIATEWMTGGIPGIKSTGFLDKTADKLINKATGKVSNELVKNISKTLLKSGYEMIGEGVEEGLSEILTPILKNSTYSNNEKIDWNNVFQSVVIGGITGGILNLPGTVSEFNTNRNNSMLPTPQEQQNIDVSNDTILNDKNPVLLPTPENYNQQLQNMAINRLNLNENIQSNINNQEIQNNLVEQDSDSNYVDEIEELPQNLTSRQKLENSFIQNGFDIDERKTKNLIDNFESIMNTREGLNIELDPNLDINNPGQYISNSDGTRTIKINPNNTSRATETILIHELFHDIDNNSKRDLIRYINDYDSKISGYEEARQNLDNLYREEYTNQLKEQNPNLSDEQISQLVDSLVEEEASADITGTLLGNQEFVNRLVQDEPSFAKKIYNWFKDLANRLTGKETKFMQTVRRNFENAYRNRNYSESEINKDLFIGPKGVNNAIKNDNRNSWLNENFNTAKELLSNKMNNEEIRQKTGWFKDKANDWKFEISDKNSKLKNIHKNNKYRLEDILDHNDLYKLYPKLKNNKIVFKDLKDVYDKATKKTYTNAGQFNTLTNTIEINNKLFDMKDSNNLIKGTLLHEIQHYIQKTEKFSMGSNAKKGITAYADTIGEQEAKDVSKRMNMSDRDRYLTNPKIMAQKNIENGQKNSYNSVIEKELLLDEDNKLFEKNISEISDETQRSIRMDDGRQELDNNSSFSNDKKEIQGLENYSEKEIKDITNRYIEEKLQENGINDINIIDTAIHGSRARGTAKSDSDLDVVVQYDSDIREDDFFNILNDNGDDNLYIDGIRVDINPIKEDIKYYMDRSNKYDKSIINSLSEQLERQGAKILEEAELKKDGMINNFKEYLSEHNISNPTQQDINDSITDIMSYDNEQSISDNVKDEKLYNQYVREYMKENNIPFSESGNIKDNQGRTLSIQQQNYFKDSKARDKNGNLIELYHGTPNDFTKFNYEKLGTNGTLLGKGFYLTDDIKVGEAYANKGDNGKIMKLYADIKKPLQWGKTTISKEQYKKFVEAINEATDGTLFADYSGEYSKKGSKQYDATLNDILMDYEYGGDDIDLISGILNTTGMSWEKGYKILKDTTGYDGIIVTKDVYDSGEGNVYIPFLPNQIKNVDNINPSTNDDIRYSNTDSGEWQERLDKVYKKQAMKGNKTYLEDNNTIKDFKIQNQDTKQKLKDREKEKIVKGFEKLKGKQTKFISKEVSKILEFDNYRQKQEFTELLSNYYDNPNYEQIKNDIKEKFSEKRIDYVNDYIRDIKREIRETDIKVPDIVKRGITDYNEFRKSNFHKLKLKNEGKSIDSLYQELSEQYPNIFTDEANTEVDQLHRLADFMNEDEKISMSYQLDDDVIDRATKYIYDSIKDNVKIDDLINSISISPKQIRKEKTIEYREFAEDFLNNSDKWKDKKIGLSYKTNTMKRNFYDVMGSKDGKRMYEEFIQPIFSHNAKMQNDITKYNDKIGKLNLTEKESTAVQMFGEYKYNPETLITGPEVDEFISKNKLDNQKIENAVEIFRNTYDELIERVNDTLKAQGYKEIDYRKGYFPHFVEERAETKFGKILEKMGWKFQNNDIPTDIAGITDQFKPGKVWNRNAQQRKGKYTEFNALKGFDNYIRGAMETIYFTEDIQKLRALENEIRYQHSDKGVQAKIDEIMNDESLSYEDRQDKMDKVFTEFKTPLNNFVTELRDYTNGLANKKSTLDRTMEQAMNRKVYSVMTNISNRLSANMVGMNLSSAITNFIPITQATSQVKSKYLLKGLKEAIGNQKINDGFESKSVFLTSRLNVADRLYKTKLEKASEKANFMFEGIDSITSNAIVRGKYYQNISEGMSEFEAIRNADEFARDLMAGRTKGEMPTIFNSKNPVVKLFSAFQLEVNNQYQYMIKDLPRDLKDETLMKLVGAFAKMFFGAWIYNQITEKVVGRKAAFSPADTLKEIYDTVTNDNLKITDKSSNILENLTQDIPFVGGLVGGGRLPISSVANPLKVIKGESSVQDEAKKALYYTVLPFGGGQLKKTLEGASLYVEKDIPGNYNKKGDLKYSVKSDPLHVAQNILFGQYSSKEAREYFDNGNKVTSAKRVKSMKEAGVSFSNAKTYDKYIKDLKDKYTGRDSSAMKIYSIMKDNNLNDREKSYMISQFGSKLNIKDLKKLENDEDNYKYYMKLNSDKKEQFIDDYDNTDLTATQLRKYYEAKSDSKNSKTKMAEYLSEANMSNTDKKRLFERDFGNSNDNRIVNNFNIDYNAYLNTIAYVNNLKKEYSGSDYSSFNRAKIFNYINSLSLSIPQKLALFNMSGYSIKKSSSSLGYIVEYLNKTNLSKNEKLMTLIGLGFVK